MADAHEVSDTSAGAADDVLEPLETISGRGFSRYDVFRDWVGLMLAALQDDDEQYLDVLEDYDRGRDRDRGERNADLFAAAFGELQAAMQEHNQDVLGDAYEAFGMQSDAFGQHFTPHNISAMMAELQTSVEDDVEPPVSIADPACGSGRLLIYAARRQDVETFCFGQDKDPLCAKMAALNCCFFNMNAAVVVGDTLTLEKRRAWQTRSTAIGGEIREVDPESVPHPEAAFEDGRDDEGESADEEPDGKRLTVEAGGVEAGQTDLTGWSD